MGPSQRKNIKRSQVKSMTDDLARVIEEQADTIMRQADMIYRLSLLLLQHCEVAQAELDAIVQTGKGESNEYISNIE